MLTVFLHLLMTNLIRFASGVQQRAISAVLVLLLSVSSFDLAFAQSGSPQKQLPCGQAVDAVTHLNAIALFGAAGSCMQDGRQEDANALLIIGQLRAVADMGTLKPIDEDNSKKVGELYMQVFFNFGGLGFDEFYRKPENVERLATRIRGTDLPYTADYDPGWKYLPSIASETYATAISKGRERRLWQMHSVALRLQNDQYYAAFKADVELRKRHPTLKQDTPAYKEHMRLQSIMRAAEKNIPQLPPPPK